MIKKLPDLKILAIHLILQKKVLIPLSTIWFWFCFLIPHLFLEFVKLAATRSQELIYIFIVLNPFRFIVNPTCFVVNFHYLYLICVIIVRLFVFLFLEVPKSFWWGWDSFPLPCHTKLVLMLILAVSTTKSLAQVSF